MNIKPLEEQTIVITGATSGIGLVTARKAAKAGAKLVLVARDEDSLRTLKIEIEGDGGSAIYVVADVADEAQVRAVSEAAREHFGGYDTWINNAGLSIFGPITEIPTEDYRRMFDINFWGIVYGSLEAARHFADRESEYSGVIINLGSAVSDRSIPLQGMYATSKHAVKGFTDALRMELEHEEVPVSLCLIKPAGIATPFAMHARNYMAEEPTLPPPIYAPELVADAILKCAEKPQRDILVGGGAKGFSMLGQYFPALGDKMLNLTIFDQQKKDRPAEPRPDSLYAPGFGLRERGEFEDRTIVEDSLYTRIMLHPWLKSALALGAAAAIAAFVSSKNRD